MVQGLFCGNPLPVTIIKIPVSRLTRTSWLSELVPFQVVRDSPCWQIFNEPSRADTNMHFECDRFIRLTLFLLYTLFYCTFCLQITLLLKVHDHQPVACNAAAILRERHVEFYFFFFFIKMFIISTDDRLGYLILCRLFGCNEPWF